MLGVVWAIQGAEQTEWVLPQLNEGIRELMHDLGPLLGSRHGRAQGFSGEFLHKDIPHAHAIAGLALESKLEDLGAGTRVLSRNLRVATSLWTMWSRRAAGGDVALDLRMRAIHATPSSKVSST